MTACIYIRVSTDEQVQGTSLQTQEAACRAWCASNGHQVAKVFCDAGETAKTGDRPQFLELVAWCGRVKPEVCVVWKFDRWARNSRDHAIYAAAIAKAGTRLVSATESTEDDPAGRLLQTILSGIAQFDNEVRGQRSQTAMRSIVQRGGWVWRAPLGFSVARSGDLPILVPDPDLAPIIADLFDGLATRRRTLLQTVTVASERGLQADSTRKLLRMPVYGGMIRSALTPSPVTAAFPGIVAPQVWQAAQDAMSSPPRGANLRDRQDFPLKSLLLCDACGRTARAYYSRGQAGRIYGYYACPEGCVRARVEAVHASWGEMLTTAGQHWRPFLDRLRLQLGEIVAERSDASADVKDLAAKRTDRLLAKKDRLLRVYLSGALDQSAYEETVADIDRDLRAAAEAEKRAAEWRMNMDAAVASAAALFADPVALWARLDVSGKHRLARVLFGVDLRLLAGGEVRTSASGGIDSALRLLSADDCRMARQPGALANFADLVRSVADLMAAAA